MTARIVTMAEIAPAIARLPVEKIAPISGVKRVVPQVGQPAPSAISPVMIPAFSRLAELFSRFLCQRKTIRPIKTPWRKESAKIGSQSRKTWFMPKMARKASLIIFRLPEKPVAAINSNFEKPPERRFISRPKRRKAGINPAQKRFDFVTRRIPFPAKRNSSSHFLQFMKVL